MIDGYVVDFLCVEHRLVLEIDGEIHLDPVQRDRDSERSAHLQIRGCFILRIQNRDVNKRSLEQVLKQFLDTGGPPSPERERGRG